jgi:hypothetical protein
MRSRLQKFTAFTNTLLPHETAYLLSIQQFKDEKRLDILKQVDHNARNIHQFTPYDVDIDKRKYNHLQNWIQTRLEAIDVDVYFNWMLEIERKIMTDAIQLEEEKELLRAIKRYQHPTFFFTKFYELVEKYRQFLLIRLRYSEYQLTENFVKTYKTAYKTSKDIQARLQKSTVDIVGQYMGKVTDSRQWEEWLSEVFYDETLGGFTRYQALVRLTFLSYNYRRYDLMKEKFDYLDKKIAQGEYYSKRLLLNYYNNRLMIHSHYKEYDKALHYGYLSIRSINHDYPLYVNNLCAVLLRLDKNEEALKLMKNSASEVKKTNNFHNRIGFVAFYMEALNKNDLCRNAESYGDTFLKAYAKEVLQYRWHLFFTVYLEAMLKQGHSYKLLKIAQKYQLLKRDKAYKANTPNYQPQIPLYIEAARYREGLMHRQAFFEVLDRFSEQYQLSPNFDFKNLLSEFKEIIPETASYLVRMNAVSK